MPEEVWLLICIVVLCDLENLKLTNQIAILDSSTLNGSGGFLYRPF